MTPITRTPVRRRWPAITPYLIGASLVALAFLGPRAILTPAPPSAPANSRAPAAVPAAASATLPESQLRALERLPETTIAESHSVDIAIAGTSTVVLANGVPGISTDRGMPVTIRGWAVDRGAHQTSSFVLATVRGRRFGSPVNGVRDDVARALAAPAYAPSGFSIAIDTSALPLGTSIVKLSGVDAARKVRYDLHRDVVLTITKSAALHPR